MTEQEEEAEQTRHGAEEGFRTEAGGNGGLYSAHLYMLQGKQRHQDKKMRAFTKHCFRAKAAPGICQGVQRKAAGQVRCG